MKMKLIASLLLATVLIVTGCAELPADSPAPQSPQSPQSTLPDGWKDGYQWATFEGDGCLFAVAGAVTVGQYRFIPVLHTTKEVAATAIKVYSLSAAGELVLTGYLISSVALIGGPVTQQLLEGNMDFTWNGQFVSINRVTGQIQAIQLATTDATQQAAEGTRADAREDIRNNSQQPKIAFVDDDWDFFITRSEWLTDWLPTTQYLYYETCQDCLNAIASGVVHTAYLLDQSGGPTLGSVCAEKIMAVDPGKPIIGMSVEDVGDKFPSGTHFVGKTWGHETMANLIRQLLKLQ